MYDVYILFADIIVYALGGPVAFYFSLKVIIAVWLVQ